MTDVTTEITRMLGPQEAQHIIRLARNTENFEARWARRATLEVKKVADKVLAEVWMLGQPDLTQVDFGNFVMSHWYDSMREGLVSSSRMPSVQVDRLASTPMAAIAKKLKELRRQWDEYRRTGRLPAIQGQDAEKLRQAFIAAIKKSWRENSDEFLSGITADNTEATRAIRKSFDVVTSRAKMIVATETTRYFNEARRSVYDQSEEVTHYLFLAIRDHRTTKWCKTRHGLVYAKGDPLLDSETPPVHWNCRSEMIPLTPHNAKHLRLIQDESRQRRRNSPEPLPAGWTAA